MSATIVKEVKLNLIDFEKNSNKVWIGRVFSDGTLETEWGRVRDNAKLQTSSKECGTAFAAERRLEKLIAEKEAKGYRESKTFSGELEKKTLSGKPADLKAVARRQIAGCENSRTTAALVEYLAEVNIHDITANSAIKFNAANATFTTPLGVLTPDAIGEARALLAAIHRLNQKYPNYPPERAVKIKDYFQIVPRDFGVKVPKPDTLLPTQKYIRQENALLDALEASIAAPGASAAEEQIFKTRLTKVPHYTDEGKAKFAAVRDLFNQTRNANHTTHNLKLVALYEVEVADMKKNFEAESAAIGNVRSDLWHGTRASNLLSILKNGLCIPPRNSAHCTGRMFGNGIYTSNQSTKALNYATSMWNRSGAANQRTFMFLCEAALGRMFKPKSSGSNFPAAGTDSTWVEPGTAGVMNHECIVYRTSQINLKYLCEFGTA